jgi:catechol 2,3-dioxygenase-like lactoylglutathione lyase family enzyme
MNQARIDGLRSIDLGVRDLQKSAEFYRKVWALEDVAAEGDSIHLRATGTDHHVVTLRERPKAGMLGVHFSAPDRATVYALHAQAKALGAKVAGDPRPLPASEGGGYGFRMSTSRPTSPAMPRRSTIARGRPSSRMWCSTAPTYRTRPRSSSTCLASSGATAPR